MTASSEYTLSDTQLIASREPLRLSHATRAVLTLAIGSVLAAFCVITIDAPLATLARQQDLPGELRRAVNLAEVFAHGTGVFLILATLFGLQPNRWKDLIWVAGCAYWSGIIADIVKLLVQRHRPQTLATELFHGWRSFDGFAAHSFSELFSDGANALHAFPSAHTATAFGFAWGLAWYFGRGGKIFFALASLAAIQRISCGAHWPSDLVAGATIACIISPLILSQAARFKTRDSMATVTKLS